MTPSDAQKLLGLTDNCTAQINAVGNDCYRVNVCKKVKKEDSIMFITNIISSHYIRYINGIYVDETKKHDK